MKLLGLSKLPPDASRSEHLMLMQQHRSLRKERVMSSSPSSLKRGVSASHLGSHGVSTRSTGSPIDVGNGGSSTVTGRRGGGAPNSRQGGGGVYEQCAGDGGGGGTEDDEEEMTADHDHHHRHQTSEWLDMRESSLRLTPTDLDDQFLKAVTDLMDQFPEPPSPGTGAAITDLSSPATSAIGRNKGDSGGIRGILPKPSSHRRPAGGMAGGNNAGTIEEVIPSRQNPIFQQQIESRRVGGAVRELESPMRICYSKPEDMFSL